VGLEQGARLVRQLAEAVDQLLLQKQQFLLAVAVGEALVERQALVHVAAVVVGQQRRRVQVDLRGDAQRLREVGLLAFLQRTHRGVEHRGVQVEADLLDLAALRFAEHLAGAADLQVVHGEEEAGTEFLHGLDRLEPALRLGARLGAAVGEQVGVGLVVRAADAAAQLVQLGQAELVGAVDEDGVGVRIVDAGLDDGRAQQQVVALLGEVAHDALQLALGQLAVADDDARLGQQLRQALAHGADGVDLVVQESTPGRRA
jgi:hypothetical protein